VRCLVSGQFHDRDGMAVGSAARPLARTVDVTESESEAAAATTVLDAGGSPALPRADPAAEPITSLDLTKLLGPETGADAVSISRFRASRGGKIEWLVARLAYEKWVVEIDTPIVTGSTSIALYWIPSTVRPAHGPQPPPPVDLANRLGISFLRRLRRSGRKASTGRRSRIRDFTMLVAHGFYVNLNPESPDSFPVRLSHTGMEALVRFERTADLGARGGGGAEVSGTIDAERLESSVKMWLTREGFELKGKAAQRPMSRASKHGAAAGVLAEFTAVAKRPRTGAAADPSRPEQVDRRGSSGETSAAEAIGEAALLEAKDGRHYLFLSLAWGAEARLRRQEIELMLGSLRLFAKSK
jgi:hypothetical protein